MLVVALGAQVAAAGLDLPREVGFAVRDALAVGSRPRLSAAGGEVGDGGQLAVGVVALAVALAVDFDVSEDALALLGRQRAVVLGGEAAVVAQVLGRVARQ